MKISRTGLACVAIVAATVTTAPVASAVDPAAPPDFVSLSDVDPTILMDIRYATPHNFTGDPVDGYRAPMCILTRPAAEALRRAQQQFLEDGYSLKVYDCYRPQRAVSDFVAWANDPLDQRMKAEYYPRVDKSQLFADGYIADKSGHSRGSTVDLTLVALPAQSTPPPAPGRPLVDCIAPQPERFPDNGIDMGTGYDCFDTLAHTLDPRVQGDQLKNRLRLKDGLAAQSLENYPNEWWHFTFKPEAHPDTYFDFVVDPSSLAGTSRG
ncbi:M15 family metallopeptidase [Mycolicibacterium arseniciresistens]|uniref:D-alanyl-D-alanine dipeptidase n=1 Tax=Mycolicibacterium arseniciresistens TaxID=3062257 RepID=A0ABT8UBY5_9MYCO|nr:M15 family metallopeptidase [Mycolicibacterium arseniciresistens]MDO3635299.1 M15 family metallopeptidase [Mycolicibacterium arseniciresistens]